MLDLTTLFATTRAVEGFIGLATARWHIKTIVAVDASDARPRQNSVVTLGDVAGCQELVSLSPVCRFLGCT